MGCIKCWDMPCVCGYEYTHYSMEKLVHMRDMFDRLIETKNEDDTDVDTNI